MAQFVGLKFHLINIKCFLPFKLFWKFECTSVFFSANHTLALEYGKHVDRER